MLRAVTFDFWGTLIDDRQSSAELRIEILGRALPDIPRGRLADAYAQAWQRFSQAGDLGYGLPPATILCDVLDGLETTLRPEIFGDVLDRWESVHLDSAPPFVSGASRTLRTLRSRGFLIGLISDTGASPGRVLRQHLVREGMRPLFDWLTFSNETGVTKQRPQAFRSTLAALGVEASEALHVGDTPRRDICGAQAVGMYAALTIEVHDKRTDEVKPDLLVPALALLPELLERWQPG